MRILMVDRNWRSGLALYTRDLCQDIAKQGQVVHLLAPTCYQLSLSNVEFETIKKLWPMRARRRYLTRLQWVADRVATASQNAFVYNRVAKKGGYDIVHFQTLTPPLDQYLMLPLVGKMMLVHTVHDTAPHRHSIIQHRTFRKKIYRLFDLLIVHYQKGKENLSQFYDVPENRIEVVPHGLSLRDSVCSQQEAQRKLKIPLGKKVLLFFGTIREDKGLDILLRAIAKIKDQLEDMVLVIAGKVPVYTDFSEYDRLIESLNIGGQVIKRIGYVPDEDVDYYFYASDVCVLSYRKFDSQSGVLMQAYAHYTPVVVTDVGAVGDMVRRDGVGVVVEPENIDSLANGIISIFRDKQKYLEKCCRATAEKHSWSKSAAMTIECYRKLLRK